MKRLPEMRAASCFSGIGAMPNWRCWGCRLALVSGELIRLPTLRARTASQRQQPRRCAGFGFSLSAPEAFVAACSADRWAAVSGFFDCRIARRAWMATAAISLSDGCRSSMLSSTSIYAVYRERPRLALGQPGACLPGAFLAGTGGPRYRGSPSAERMWRAVDRRGYG